ncbi:MAG: Hpt domain-containing protein [Ignavibacteria bacterium]|jgi:chemotaxis protein histidine kinase CheA|nr:Hpt domain-containing protein [Ignavibacteria bacterium]HRI30265.1 Hpt domain-containing protein [Candidatus Kapabacteria bacterium]
MKLPEDEIILELLPEFLDSWLFDMEHVLPKLISTKNSADLRRFGHTLKGSAAQFGFEDLRDMGIKMMALAEQNDFDNAEDFAKTIVQRLQDIKHFIESQNSSS